MGRFQPSMRAGCVYFLAVFAAECAFAPIQETFVFLGLDPFKAVLFEAPAMLLIMYLAAAWIVRAFRTPMRIGHRLAMGATGMTLILTADLLTEFAVRGWRVQESLSAFATPGGSVLGVVLLLGLLMPILQMRERLALHQGTDPRRPGFWRLPCVTEKSAPRSKCRST